VGARLCVAIAAIAGAWRRPSHKGHVWRDRMRRSCGAAGPGQQRHDFMARQTSVASIRHHQLFRR
jgi:hypothetical protein